MSTIGLSGNSSSNNNNSRNNINQKPASFVAPNVNHGKFRGSEFKPKHTAANSVDLSRVARFSSWFNLMIGD